MRFKTHLWVYFYNIKLIAMSLKASDIKKYSIKLAEKGEVLTWIGPCSVKKIDSVEIPMDGRKYECGGTIYLANGLDLQASFRIKI